MKKKILLPCLLLFAVNSFQSCKKEPSLSGGSSFSLDKFEQNIKNTYPPGVVGYSYAISYLNKVERFGAGGEARIAADGLKAYTIETRQELFSVTKFVTAIAVCKVLGDLGKTLNEKVVNYLPANWKIHASYNDLSFEQLLSHKSGFSLENRDFTSLQKMMTIPQVATAYNYNNANYALCRILLPYMYYGKENYKFSELQGLTENSTATDFRIIIREKVLLPSGLQYWDKADFKDWNHQGITPFQYTLYYLKSNLAVASDANSDDVLIAGSRGLTLTSYEVAQILTAFENKKLLSESWMNEMKNKKCGFDSWVNGTHGNYYWKNGGWTTGTGTGGETIIMVFPNGVRVSLNCNSNRKLNDQFVGNPANMAKAYDDAW
jgi:CubicO group peptidase (beta-lactamase class C family)